MGMRKIYSAIILVLIVILWNACSSSKIQSTKKVSLEEMMGQMIMVGFRGLEISEDSTIAKDIKAGKVGGVILFNRDVALGTTVRNITSPEQVKKLNASLQSFAKIPLFIAVDQEGGKVVRLRADAGFPTTVSQQYLGTLNLEDSTRFYAHRMAAIMKEVGFNVNFAPSVDVNVNPASPVIGAIGRSFSGDTSIVTRHARIIIDEQSKNKIISVLKHFPGHGSAGADSHLGFVDVSQTWQSYELAPYRALIQSGKVEMIMTAHIFNSQWDAQYPATLSRYVITEMLRNQLGFKGVVISDDMNMKAISEYYSFEKAIEMAVNAGVDILLIANNINYDQQAASKTLNVLKQLVQEGKISPERIEESYNRIMALKKQQLAS